MAELPLPRSALASLDLTSRTGPAGEGAGVTLAQRRFLGKLNLRGDVGDGRFGAAVRAILGTDPPVAPDRVAAGEAATLLWLGPDEWLAVCAGLQEAAEFCDRLAAALEAQHAAAVDVSSGWTVIRLAGASGKAVLQKGCSLDLDAPRFSAGHCAATRVGNANVVLHQVEGDPEATGAVYDLYVPRSYVLSFWQWLEDASAEYGLAVSLA